MEQDLLEHPAKVLSSALGLRDHLLYHKNGSLLSDDGDTRRLREYVSEGRHLLHALGAWPWTHAKAGPLPKRWWQLEQFTAPLAIWHQHNVDAIREEADLRASAFAGDGRWGRGHQRSG
jgi:hypothetical protein